VIRQEGGRGSKLFRRLYATIASLVLRLPVSDTQRGAKLFRSSPALVAALEQPVGSRWAFEVEFLKRLQQAWGHLGFGTIVEMPLTECYDVGESNVSLRAGARAVAFLLRLGLRPSPRLEAMSPRVPEQEVADRMAAGDDR
jgi:dolichyl-phosphate beta-glucosyltransferase